MGEQWGREKCRANNFTTVWTPERSSYMCGNVCAWKSIFIWLHVNSKCLTLLELIPIKSFQRAAVCQSLTPLQQDEKEQPTNSISRTEQRRWCRADKTYNIRLRGWLSSTCRAKATGCLTGQNCGNSSKDHFSDKRMHLSGWEKKEKSKTITACWLQNEHYSNTTLGGTRTQTQRPLLYARFLELVVFSWAR